MNRIFKRSNRSTQRDHNEINNQQTTTNIEKSQETDVLTGNFNFENLSIYVNNCFLDKEGDDKSSHLSSITEENKPVDDKSPSHPTEIFVTTINHDSTITEEKKSITPTTPNEEKTDENIEQEQFKFIPRERKPRYTFIMLISSQGQEVLKSKDLIQSYCFFFF